MCEWHAAINVFKAYTLLHQLPMPQPIAATLNGS